MLIVESSDKKYKIVSVNTEGWFFYEPPIQKEGEGIFISIDDSLVLSLAEELKMDKERLIRSRKAAEILLVRLINSLKDKKKKQEAYALV